MSVVILSVVVLRVIILSVIILSVIILSVIIMSAVNLRVSFKLGVTNKHLLLTFDMLSVNGTLIGGLTRSGVTVSPRQTH